jgi:hypothetical protein
MISVLADKPARRFVSGVTDPSIQTGVVCSPQLNLSIRIDRALSGGNVPGAAVPPNLLPNLPDAAEYKPNHKRD